MDRFGIGRFCYAGWAAALWGLAIVSPILAAVVLTAIVVLHSSLTHEVIHGHPFRTQGANEVLMALPLTLAIPFQRFRDMHLAHRRDSKLTDPYDDPESNYLDGDDWNRLTRPVQALLSIDNTLAGRILLGPGIGQIAFTIGDWRALGQSIFWGLGRSWPSLWLRPCRFCPILSPPISGLVLAGSEPSSNTARMKNPARGRSSSKIEARWRFFF